MSNGEYTHFPPSTYENIAAAGNSENKALTLGILAMTGRQIESTALHNEFYSIQGDEPVWRLANETTTKYGHSFDTAGLVEVTFGEDGKPIFEISDSGLIAAKGIAHLLDISGRYDPSLNQIFGPMPTPSSTGIRPCQSRIALLELLADNSERRVPVAEASDYAGLSQYHALYIAERLATGGVVEVGSTGRGNSLVSYRPTEGIKKVADSARKSVSQVYLDVVDAIAEGYEHYAENPPSNAELAEVLIAKYGYEKSVTELTKDVAKRTHRLAEEKGVLIAERQGESVRTRSTIGITNDQGELIKEVLEVVGQMSDPDTHFLATGRRILKGILSNPQKVNLLVAKCRASSSGNKKSTVFQANIVEAIEHTIAGAQEPPTVRQIKTILDEQKGIKLSDATVRKHADEISRQNGVTKVKTKHGVTYMVG